MHTDPHEVGLVLEQIDVVVAGSDGAELMSRRLLEVGDTSSIPEGGVEQLVIDLYGIALADEADRGRYRREWSWRGAMSV
jgi:hypothetical protein